MKGVKGVPVTATIHDELPQRGYHVGLPHTEAVPVELYHAARVRRFMAEEQVGRWRLHHFSRTRAEYEADVLRTRLTSDHPDMEEQRIVPAGDYVTLQRRMIDAEVRQVFEDALGVTVEQAGPDALAQLLPSDRQWTPVMSDTPAEILEHAPALLHASGRILITGLGLGCLPHALLAGMHRVTRIDIIEIAPQVIRLTGKYLTDPRVHIHRASAIDDPRSIASLASQWPMRWDYAWHDIWTHISSKNLDPKRAEHGISYGMLFEHWAPYVKRQQQEAWALPQAQQMAMVQAEERAEELEFQRYVRTLPIDEQVDALVNRILADKLGLGKHHVAKLPDGKVPEQIAQALDPEGGLRDHVRAQVSAPDFWERYERDRAERDADDVLGRPNEES